MGHCFVMERWPFYYKTIATMSSALMSWRSVQADFFCNLPNNVKRTAEIDLNFWKLTTTP
jgi:hypothetical protein